jgi:hypothetical protein
MSNANPRGRWVALITGGLSILIAIAYLALITVLDSRGPLLPPPPEALAGLSVPAGGVAIEDPSGAAAEARPPA